MLSMEFRCRKLAKVLQGLVFLRYYAQNASNKIHSRDSVVARYVKRQMTDEFTKLAKSHNYRARSAFKLLEINKKFKIFKKDNVVMDVGAAPGSWCQVVSEILFPVGVDHSHSRGYILGVDLKTMSSINHVDLITQADITRVPTHNEIKRRLNGRWLDVVLSDIAPNPTGDSLTDHERIVSICRTLFCLISNTKSGVLPLNVNGRFVCKLWDGHLRVEFMNELQEHFKIVQTYKPNASRENSSEVYVCASGYKLV